MIPDMPRTTISIKMCAQLSVTLLAFCGAAFGQASSSPQRVWSVGPLSKSEQVVGVAFGPGGPTITPSQVDTQTSSIFSATRSVIFAGERVVVSVRVGSPPAKQLYRLFSLDLKTGEVMDSRDFVDLGVRAIFGTSDAHVIISGDKVLRLTPDLKDSGSFDYRTTEHKFGRVQNESPDGSTLGIATNPGFELLDSKSLAISSLTTAGSVDTSINTKGFITDNVHWIRDYPKDLSFVTYVDLSGQHLLYHGKCGGRPQFLTDELILEPGCKTPVIIDMHGSVVRTVPLKGEFSYAGVSQNGKRFALQVADFTGNHTIKHEKFVIYSTETGEPITEVKPDEQAEEQSWTAFAPDGTLFVVGSPIKLTLYRLP
jgi:hypothetical protein